jgi:Helix-turn-helix
VTTFQTQLLNELGAGADGEPISQSKLVYLQERLRGRFFDFLLGVFEDARKNGLTQAKLARRIRKPPEVINRWFSAPSNLTLDSISDLLAGISAGEPEFSASSLIGRSPVNYSHLDDAPAGAESSKEPTQDRKEEASALKSAMEPLRQDETSARAFAA